MPALTDVYQIDNFIDTFALGHYARVLAATDQRNGRNVALKIMRSEHVQRDDVPRWEAQAFVHEVDLLSRVFRNPVPVQFYDCGFILADGEYPTEGEIISYDVNIGPFRDALFSHNAKGWRPYIALEYLPRYHNLLYLMKPDQQGQRRRLPTEEGLNLAMQFGRLLIDAHEQGIVYMDHKLEHVYWDGQQLRLIDWNSSKRIEAGGQTLAQSCQKDIHNLCVGILYPLFTGLSPQRGGLRPQPAGIQEVDARYSDVNHLDFTVEPTLSPLLMDLMERGARQEIATAEEFLQRVEHIATHFGWEFRYQTTSPVLTEARQHIQTGLEKLRTSTDLAREAREMLLEAAILDGINEDIENELRRLLKDINDFLSARVIP
ncbi:MAG: hypothetical protein GYB66_02990 [Chloroflexi bacterium]|nr:hypothetical protein [Chloroflexota bacterium]